MLCPHLVADHDAVAIAERVVAAVQQPFEEDGVQVAIGASVGIATTEPGRLDAGAAHRRRRPGALPGQGRGSGPLAPADLAHPLSPSTRAAEPSSGPSRSPSVLCEVLHVMRCKLHKERIAGGGRNEAADPMLSSGRGRRRSSTVPTVTDHAALVDERLDQLLSELDPATTDATTFRGRQYDLGLAMGALPGGLRRARRAPGAAAPDRASAAGQGRGAREQGVLRAHDGRPDGRDPRRRGAQAAPAAPDVHRRGRVVPAVQRARARARTWPAWPPGRCATATSGSSPARRCGTRWPTSPTGGCSSPAPIRRRRSTRA